VAVDETVIQLDDQQYWLYAVVDPDCRNALQTAVEQIVNSMELNSDTTTQTEYAGL
jgi:transposase-like protein